VVEYVNIGEGGGSSRFTFQQGMSYQDGFLLLNYFENLHISKEEIEDCESFDLTLAPNALSLYTIGLRGGIGWMVKLLWQDGMLIIEVGGGC
jgi:hypothetical protein